MLLVFEELPSFGFVDDPDDVSEFGRSISSNGRALSTLSDVSKAKSARLALAIVAKNRNKIKSPIHVY